MLSPAFLWAARKASDWGPCLEIRFALPHRVRGIERVVIVLQTAQEVKGPEPGHLLERRFPLVPDRLEGLFLVRNDAKAVHGKIHGGRS